MNVIRIDITRLLLLIAAALGAIIILGTLIALIAGKCPGMDLRREDPSSIEQIKGADEDLSSFKEFGTLRAMTMPAEDSEERAALVVTPWFSYHGNDSAFYEELVAKKKFFTSVFLEFFSTRTKNALLSIGEKEIKRQLLERFNSELTLGKLNALYFDDYMFLD